MYAIRSYYEMKAQGMKADFRATGQTGIFIAGSGVSYNFV